MSEDARLAAGIRPVAVILLTGAWVAAHGLRPLTYGNHNTYLVRGLAAGGYADLSADPLLGSPDPAWIFSTLVEAAWRLAGSIGLSLLFSLFALPYVLGLLLLAVQAAGRDAGRHDHDARDHRWLLVIAAGLVVLHSRALDMVPAVGDGLAVGRLLTFGVAGQYVFAAQLQPCVAGGLLVLAIALFARRRPWSAMIAAVAAAYLHPTYLLSAGVLVGVLAVTELRGARVARSVRIAAAALALVLPLLVILWARFGGVDADDAALARSILAEHRLPHHAQVARWWGLAALLQLSWIALAAHRCRGRALALLFWAGLGFCVVGSLAQVVSGSNALGLLFPWRMSAVLVPAATAIIWGCAVRWLRGTRAARRSPVVAGAVMISVLCFGVFWTWRQWGKPVDHAHEPAYQLVARTVSHDLPGQRWWVPSDFEAFRLAARRAVWCDLKSHPYDPVHVIAWWHCMEQVEALQRGALTCADAYAVARVAGVTHVLVRRDVADRLACRPAELEQVATSDAFAIFGVKREQP